MSIQYLAIVGATSSGKSALAIELAARLGGEIVNADALQAYRRLSIGTGKPSVEDRRRVPHHLLEVLEPDERFSAGEFVRRALPAIRDIANRGHLPIVVGGSGLYLRALRQGLSPIPEVTSHVKRAVETLEADQGTEGLHRELAAIDPEAAVRLGVADRQRLRRALEVVLSSGRTLSEWWREGRQTSADLGPALLIGLTLPRALLYDRIARRVESMVAAGWEQEVQQLLSAGVHPAAPAFQAIGYRQWVETISDRRDREETIASIVQATRRYAKRQDTWFRKERDITWLDSTQQDAIPQVLRLLAAGQSVLARER